MLSVSTSADPGRPLLLAVAGLSLCMVFFGGGVLVSFIRGLLLVWVLVLRRVWVWTGWVGSGCWCLCGSSSGEKKVVGFRVGGGW